MQKTTQATSEYFACTSKDYGLVFKKFINKSWGYEAIHVNTSKYCMKTLHIFPGSSTSMHYHKDKTETLYIAKGCLQIEYFIDHAHNANMIYLNEGMSFTVIPNLKHKLINNYSSEAIIVEASTFDSPQDSYRMEQL
jgi:mannose-6-phosphate isomerase-like protein (cupin superfamily)